jgi:hypothetical protein
LPPLLLSGPVDPDKNSDFISASNPIVSIGGNSITPLVCQINGYNYYYYRKLEINFTTVTPDTDPYYLYMTEDTVYGKELTTGTVDVTKNNQYMTDGTANFTVSGVKAGHLVKFSSILIGGQPLVLPIATVATTTLTFSGRIPETLLSTPYAVYNPREGAVSYSLTRDTDYSKLYLGEATWTGSSLSVINYRYLNKYTSALKSASASSGSYILDFDHNLGFIPSTFTLYFYETLTSIPKVLHIGDEALVQTTRNVLSVKNRYASLVARSWTGTALDTGYIQLVM